MPQSLPPGFPGTYIYPEQPTTRNVDGHVHPRYDEVHMHWDMAFRAFLEAAGLTQALRGFENDMLVLNPEWEKGRVRNAVGKLIQNLLVSRRDT